MRLSTRLLLPLLATVAIVMTAFAAWAVRQRETSLAEQSEREIHAYALALGQSIESAFRDPTPDDIQQIIDRISRERTIYGVLVYGEDGELLYVSDPLGTSATAASDVVRGVIATGQPASIRRDIDDQEVYSVVRPIPDQTGNVLGAFEVAQPLSYLGEQIRQTRQRFLLNTITLLVAVTILILWLIRHLISAPLSRFVTAAQALGRGELTYRIGPATGGAELAELAGEFNRMATHLESARTDLVRQGEERVALERRLRETEKLAALGNLAAGLAHETAAPLHVIRGRAELLLKRTPAQTGEERNLRIIIEQIGRITVIVRNLLDFARRREPHFEEIDLGQVIGSVVEFLDWELGRAGVGVERTGARSVPIRGDADLLHQVFINLFINAIHALEQRSPESARIIVRTSVERAAATAGEAAGEAVIIEIEDNGPGVPVEILPHVFEAFVTTKAHGGTGLGLAVARSIIEEHGGRIDVENVEERGGAACGARFRIALPVAGSPVEAHV